ncbi:hypothetical protein D0C36_23595 [Mucilaginibacter conchicola]|uniref:Uncharacterized protein n=1 Tax=Mucilaginibacter conchicola TaxID=2303333 RepID=A0A372NNQ6_9SPHI|nr:hypothetical protein [Mucilaginibacter conchicola]RFZ90015.1 hypothetical protein D0C36_23595 [Mucilaginibacter conchicola]
MISKVLLLEQCFEVYDEQSILISTLPCAGKILAAFGSSFYVINNLADDIVEVYNPLSQRLSFIPVADKIVLKVINDAIIVRNGVFIESYDILLNKLYINNTTAAYSKLTEQALVDLRSSTKQHLEIINALKSQMAVNDYYSHLPRLSEISKLLDEIRKLSTD